MSAPTKDGYNESATRQRRAFQEIARTLGKDHAITQMMGSLAWGRHNAEQGPDGNLRSAIRESAYLEGYFDALNLWARDHDKAAQRTLLGIWSRRQAP